MFGERSDKSLGFGKRDFFADDSRFGQNPRGATAVHRIWIAAGENHPAYAGGNKRIGTGADSARARTRLQRNVDARAFGGIAAANGVFKRCRFGMITAATAVPPLADDSSVFYDYSADRRVGPRMPLPAFGKRHRPRQKKNISVRASPHTGQERR